MGLLSWLLSGAIAFALCRFLAIARTHWIAELSGAVIAAVLAGLVATAADFGGWGELDIRAVIFCLLGGFSALAAVRLTSLALSRP